MLQVNGGGRFRPPPSCGSDMQNMVAAANGGVGIWVKLYLRVLFHFLVLSTRLQLTLRSMDFSSVHPTMCFGGGCDVPLGSVCPGVKSSPFYLHKPYANKLRLECERFLSAWLSDLRSVLTWTSVWSGNLLSSDVISVTHNCIVKMIRRQAVKWGHVT